VNSAAIGALSRRAGPQKRDHGRAGRKSASQPSQWRVSTASNGASALPSGCSTCWRGNDPADFVRTSMRPLARVRYRWGSVPFFGHSSVGERQFSHGPARAIRPRSASADDDGRGLITEKRRVPASAGGRSDGLATNGGGYDRISLRRRVNETENHASRPGIRGMSAIAHCKTNGRKTP
jgi:hypothetical protein